MQAAGSGTHRIPNLQLHRFLIDSNHTSSKLDANGKVVDGLWEGERNPRHLVSHPVIAASPTLLLPSPTPPTVPGNVCP